MNQNLSHAAERATIYREYLCLLARLQLAARWTSKIDVSGVVQQTLWEASRSQLPHSDIELLACLRKILALNRMAFELAVYDSPGASPCTTQHSLPVAGQALPDGLSTRRIPKKGF